MAPMKRLASESIESGAKKVYEERNANKMLSCKFCPVLSMAEYIDTLQTEDKTHLLVRALRLQDRARRAEQMDASEFCFEAHAWEDVFGLIQDDLALRIPGYLPSFVWHNTLEFQESFVKVDHAARKRKVDLNYRDKVPYTAFAKVRGTDRVEMIRRTPDATLGLRADNEGGSILEPSRLRRLRFDTKIHTSGDPGAKHYKDTNVLFPFAVYEAKKDAASVHEAERQVAQACDRYLGLLDNVVRDPMDSSTYQSKTSRGYQIFALTSCGANWKVFKATRDDKFYLKCLDPIWEGDVTTQKDATGLLCIVDQIQQWAVSTYRPFVVQHLKRREWLAQIKRLNWNKNGFLEPEVDDPELHYSSHRHTYETYKCMTRIRYVDREEWRRKSIMRKIRRPHDDIIIRRRICID
ncbi:hypothetical protein Hte_003736 [Hypoxylon texense]